MAPAESSNVVSLISVRARNSSLVEGVGSQIKSPLISGPEIVLRRLSIGCCSPQPAAISPNSVPARRKLTPASAVKPEEPRLIPATLIGSR